MSDRYDITATRNVGWAESFEFVDGETGAPLDFAGWSGRLQVRLYGAAPGLALIDLAPVTSDVQGVRVAGLAAGTAQAMIGQAALAALPAAPEAGEAARFVFDLVLTDPAGVAAIFLAGDFHLHPGVTRP